MDSFVLRRFTIALLAAALTCLASSPGASGKGRVLAHLQTPVALDAAPGASLELAWTLRSPQATGSQAVALSGVFVELRDASGGKSTVGRATSDGGRYRARVTVPAGGIGRIAIGLQGTRYVGGAPGSTSAVATPAPRFFEIENDPLAAGRTEAAGHPPAPAWPWVLAGFGALTALLLASRASRTSAR